MKKILFVIANQNFQDTEFQVPRSILEKAGFEIIIAAGQSGECVGKFGLKVKASISLPEITNLNDYIAVVFVGGGGAYEQYLNNPDYLRMAREAKLVAAICIAPLLVSDAGVIQGKQFTVWNNNDNSQKNYIENNGGIYSAKAVVVDGNLITANGPQAAEEFAQNIISYLKK